MGAQSTPYGSERQLVDQCFKRLGVTVGVGALRLRQRLEPVSDFVEAFFASGFRHAWVHVGVLVRLASDGRLQVVTAGANRQIGKSANR